MLKGLIGFLFVRRLKICLSHARRPHHYLEEPPTTSTVSPHSHVTFMIPQTGPTPPVELAPESRRRRGCRSQILPPPPEAASQIRCKWTGCGVQVAYNQTAISRHINAAHKGKSLPVICGWERSSGGICGAIMQPNHLRRHTLDLHTALMIAWCDLCGEAQRKDVMSRHKKSCERRMGMIPR